jgi:hypothetical protein
MSERRQISLDVVAWSLVEPTRLHNGTTVELGADSAVLELAGVSEAATRLELRVALPDAALLTTATIVARRPPDLVVVSLDELDSYDRARLSEFIRSAQ